MAAPSAIINALEPDTRKKAYSNKKIKHRPKPKCNFKSSMKAPFTK